MPPKKKGSSKTKLSTEDPQTAPLSEVMKEAYLIQIRDLEGRLARYQRQWDELQAKDATFQAQLEQQSMDKKEIVSFLKRMLDQRTEEIAELTEQVARLQLAKDAEKDSYELQLAKLRHESQETKDRLTSENMQLAGKLSALEEFKVQKEEFHAQFAALEEKLAKQQEEHKELMYNLEKKAVLDKDRLKKEMVQRVNMVAAEFRKVSNCQIAETTKLTIRENVSICAQLARMSERSTELFLENDRLMEGQVEKQRHIDLLEHNEKDLVKKNLSAQKVIRMMTDKCQNLQQLLDEALEKEELRNDLEDSFQSLQAENESLRQRVAELETELQRLQSEGTRQSDELQKELDNKKMLETILSQAAKALKDVLLEKASDEDDVELDLARDERRNEMLHKLMVLLNSAAALGLGPRLREFLSQGQSYIEHKASPKGERCFPLSPVLKDTPDISHYRIGDLGLVPRNDHNPALLSKVGMLSRTTQLGPLRGCVGAPKYLCPITDREKLSRQTLGRPSITPRHNPQESPLLIL